MTTNQKTRTKTIKSILEQGKFFLESKGIENSRQECEKLIEFGLGIKKVDLYINYSKPVNVDELDKLRTYFKERASGKPVQYIIGKVHFRYLQLNVNENVLIPRNETEQVVDIVLRLISQKKKVLDLGTGSGAIALAIAQEAKVKVDAVDISSKALVQAKENAKLNNIEEVNWMQSDWFENIDTFYDLIVCNPPYVSYEQYQNLPTEIKDHEPIIALTDERDGLKCLEKIITQAPNYLNKKGHLLLEIGFDQKEVVQALLDDSGFTNIAFEKDLASKDRFVVASL